MKLAIWTKSPPKVLAVQSACQNCPFLEWITLEFVSESVDHGISEMPLTLEENIAWATNRAANIKQLLESKWEEADFYVGMEWWSQLIWEKAFLFWVVCILDNAWNKHLWMSSMIEIPEEVQKRLYEDWEELWPIMDDILSETDTKKWIWAIWHWSNGVMNREQEFKTAFICALSPFFSHFYK